MCTPDDVHISFLPLAHMMERAVQVSTANTAITI